MLFESQISSIVRLQVNAAGKPEATAAEMTVNMTTTFGALKWGLLCWIGIYVFGMLAYLNPLFHLPILPLWIIVGPYAGLTVFRFLKNSLGHSRPMVTCPVCAHPEKVDLKLNSVPHSVACTHCKETLTMTLANPEDVGLTAELLKQSEVRTNQLISHMPWPFNSREKARMLPSIVLQISFLCAVVLSFVSISWIGTQAYNSSGVIPEAAIVKSGTLGFVARLLIAIAAILTAAKLMGAAFRKINQPAVMGEVVAGIILGPSVLGQFVPAFQAQVIGTDIGSAIRSMAEIGVVFFMFLVGIDLRLDSLKKKMHSSVAISHASIAVPFLGGSFLSLLLYRYGAGQNVSFTVFSMFIGVAMSITAFPVLARIIDDLKIGHTPLGAMVIACASVDDITAWCLLALVLGVAQNSLMAFFMSIGSLIGFLLFFVKFLKPLMDKLCANVEEYGRMTLNHFAIVAAFVIGSALVTELIGIHALFGAFVVGAIIPKDSRLGIELTGNLKTFVLTILLPAFFAYSGMRTQLGLLDSWSAVAICLLVILVAMFGKIGGAFFAARMTGMPVRESAAIGILMNARGLVELVVLNIGLDNGIISESMFTTMVIMALVTTLMTGPLVSKILGLRFNPSGVEAGFTGARKQPAN
jgi:Kef-type K+ transport system membrane component KefB